MSQSRMRSMEASVPGTSSATVSTERDPGNAVDIGASGAERRSRRRTAHPTTVSSIGARRSTPSSRSESRALACPRSPGSKGWPGTPSPAGSNEPPPGVVDLAKAGLLASSSKSFKPTRSARSPVGRRGPRGFLRRLRCGLASGRRPSSGGAATGTRGRSCATSRRAWSSRPVP